MRGRRRCHGESGTHGVLCFEGVKTECLCEMGEVNCGVAEMRSRVEVFCWLVHAAALQIYLYRLGFLPREFSCTAAYFPFLRTRLGASGCVLCIGRINSF